MIFKLNEYIFGLENFLEVAVNIYYIHHEQYLGSAVKVYMTDI